MFVLTQEYTYAILHADIKDGRRTAVAIRQNGSTNRAAACEDRLRLRFRRRVRTRVDAGVEWIGLVGGVMHKIAGW
jgi:hypothetical protein